jgi:hypothetical protein
MASAMVAIAISSGCGAIDFMPLVEATSTVSETFTSNDAPLIIVDTFNGAIDVSDDAQNEVVVEVTKRARGIDQDVAEANLSHVEVTILQKENTIQVIARSRGQGIENLGASVVIAAPKGAKLQLRSSNGHIVCEGTQGGIKAHTSNGKIEAVAARGAIQAATSNGGIDIDATEAVVDARSSNGSVRFKGTLASSEQQFTTSNGSIRIALPPDSQFSFDAATSNGKVSCDFDHAGDGNRRGTQRKGTVGDHPTASIQAKTSNGSIQIRKAGLGQD